MLEQGEDLRNRIFRLQQNLKVYEKNGNRKDASDTKSLIETLGHEVDALEYQVRELHSSHHKHIETTKRHINSQKEEQVGIQRSCTWSPA